MEFRAFLCRGEDTEKRNCSRVEIAAALTAKRCEFLVVGDPVHSFAQLTCSRSVWYGADVCRVELLFVTSQHRCCGVGRALMAAAEDRALSRGCSRLELDTNEHNVAAVALYRSLGYICENPDWRNGRDIYMHKALDAA